MRPPTAAASGVRRRPPRSRVRSGPARGRPAGCGSRRPVDDHRLAGADAEVGAEFVVALEASSRSRPSPPLSASRYSSHSGTFELADRAGQRGHEVVVDRRIVRPRPGCGRRDRCTASRSPARRPPRRRRSRARAGSRRPSSAAAAASRRPAARSRSTSAGIVERKSSRQLPHCRSAKTWIETGASAEPSRSPSWGTPPKISWAVVDPFDADDVAARAPWSRC